MKDCTTCKYGYEDERLGFPMCHHPKRFSEDCVDFNMHEEKEIKESEEPISAELEEASSKFATHTAPNGVSVEFLVEKLSFQEGAKWQKEQMMKDAVEGEVSAVILRENREVHYAITYPGGESPHSITDKVRIIILSKEDSHDTRRKE